MKKTVIIFLLIVSSVGIILQGCTKQKTEQIDGTTSTEVTEIAAQETLSKEDFHSELEEREMSSCDELGTEVENQNNGNSAAETKQNLDSKNNITENKSDLKDRTEESKPWVVGAGGENETDERG